jgi:PKD repeat protein
MEKNYKFNHLLKLVFAVLFAGVFNSASAQLSGTYTLDSTVATGGTNFKTWADFRTAITGSGVNAAVILNVMTDRVEIAQLNFTSIAGTSSTNTVTINGNNKVLQASVSDAIVLLNGADWVKFDKLTVRNTTTSQYAEGYRFQNNSDNNTISNGTIEFSAMSSATTGGGAFIAFSTSATSVTTSSSTNHGANNTISNNLMRTTNVNSPGPSYAIVLQGSNSTYNSVAQNNTVTGNTIQNFYYTAIYMYYTNGVQVLNNDISRANATSNNCYSTIYGIYSYYAYSANRPTKMDGNNMHDWPYSGATVSNAPSYVYAFNVYYSYGTVSYRFSMSNNKLERIKANVSLYLGYTYQNYYMDLVGNFANDDDVTLSSSSSYNFYGWYTNYNYNSYRINNNTIQNCDGGYYWYALYNNYPTTSSGVTEMNGNIIQNNSTGYYYSYYMYIYYAQYSNATYPMDVMKNVVKNNIAPNTTTNFTYMMYFLYYGTYRIHDNVFDGNSSNYYNYGWYIQYYMNLDIQRNTITNNKAGISSSQGYMYTMYIYLPYDFVMSHNLIANNVGYYTTYAWYIYLGNSGNYKGDFIQNTLIVKGSSYSSHYIYCYGLCYYPTLVRWIGNIFDFQSSYGAYIYFYNYSTQQFQGNSYYGNGLTNQYWSTTSTSTNSAAAWVAQGLGTNEIAMPSGHNFASNFASNRFVNQNNIANVTAGAKDVYGVLRNPAKSDRGAVEGVLDIAQTLNTFSPPSPVCAGYTTSPTLTFKNNFAEPVTGFTVAMSDNGVIKAAKVMTNTIPIGGTNTVTFNPITFSQAGSHVIKFFLLDADDLPSNDSMTFTFNILKSPGGATLTHNTAASSPFAMYNTDGKPDVTFPDEKLVWNLSNPKTLPYSNSDYQGQGGGNKWISSVTAKTINGYPAPVASRVFNNGVRVTVDAPKMWEDSTIEVSIIVTDLTTFCDTVYKRKVLIAPKAVPAVKLPSALCEKSELYFESMSTVSSGAIDYTWDFGDGSPISTEASPVHKFTTFGTYNVKLTTTTNPWGFPTTKIIPVNITEVPSAKILNTNACFGTAVKLTNGTVYGGSGTTTYSWDYGDGSAVNNTTNAAPISKSFTTPGGYLVTLTASADGCASTVTKIVYQFAKPVANYSKVSGSCLNSEFTFDNNSSIPLGQFGSLWDFDDAGNRATLKEPSYTFNTAGVKNVKLKVVSEFGCTDSMSIPITVKQIPTTNFTYPFACSRTATPFTNTTNLNNEVLKDYKWDFGDGFTSSAPSPIKNWTTIGPRIVKLTTNLQNGCSTSESKTINVGVQPNVNFNVEDRCAGTEVPFSNMTTFSQGVIVYQWNFGDGNTSATPAPVHAYGSTVSQTYTVKLKASIVGGCADSFSKTVTIQPLPTTCSFDINGKINAAKTSPMQFVPTGGLTTGITYTWLTGDGNSLTSTASGTQYTYASPGKYCVTMTAKNVAGCECSTTKCVALTTDISSAESMNNAVSVYPNPNSGIFNVTLAGEISSDMTVNVYNTLGELVRTVVADANTTSIDLSEFASGVYVVKVIADNQIATKKITVSR